jgi:hypothetical protein
MCSLKRADRYLNFGTQTIGIMETESKQKTRALLLPTIVTRTRRHTELTKKSDKADG